MVCHEARKFIVLNRLHAVLVKSGYQKNTTFHYFVITGIQMQFKFSMRMCKYVLCPDTNDHPQRGIYSVAIILRQQHHRREI